MLAESLRLTDHLDAGLARKEGEDANLERVAGIRALNRALSKNSASFRKSSRGFEASGRIDALNTGSARFNSSSVAITIDGIDPTAAAGRETSGSKSIGSSQSFNMALRRSSSVGSSCRYIRQLLGLNYEPSHQAPGKMESGCFPYRLELLSELLGKPFYFWLNRLYLPLTSGHIREFGTAIFVVLILAILFWTSFCCPRRCQEQLRPL